MGCPIGELPDASEEGSMTTRFSGFMVTLREDIREDDAQPIRDALMQLRAVADVQPIVADMHAPEVFRDRHEVAERLIEMARYLVTPGGLKPR